MGSSRSHSDVHTNGNAYSNTDAFTDSYSYSHSGPQRNADANDRTDDPITHCCSNYDACGYAHSDTRCHTGNGRRRR